jgi:hypothetical protein
LRSGAACERQARCYEFASVKDYLLQIIAARLTGDEEDTVLTGDGRFVSGCYAYNENLSPRNL